jgi:membrane protein DedA with SNARE-associated domain
MVYPKEVSKIWSNRALDELDKELLELLKSNRTKRRNSIDPVDESPREYGRLWISIEFFLLTITAITIWVVFVYLTLKYLQFPVQTHKWLVGAFYIVPIFIIFLVLVVIDCLFDWGRKEKIS